MSKKAIAQIEIEGLSDQLSPYLEVHITQQLFGHHEFEVYLPLAVVEGAGKNVLNQSRDLIGKQVKISLETTGLSENQSHLFIGLITHVGFARSHGGSSQLIVRGKSPTILLEDGANCRGFSEMGLDDIAQEIMGSYPANLLSFQANTENPSTYPFVVQYQETNYQFLARLADRHGTWFFYNGEEIRFGTLENEDPIKMLLGSDLHSFDLGLDMLPVNGNYHSYHYLSNETFRGEGTQASVSTLDNHYGEPVFTESENLFADSSLGQSFADFSSQSELDDFVLQKRSQQASKMVILHGKSENVQVKLGAVIEIAGRKSDNKEDGLENYGQFRVIQVRHHLNGNGNYQNIFEAIPLEATFPPSNPFVSRPQVQAQYAKVIDNFDPDQLGRVRVQFYWQTGSDITPWIRMVQPAAGPDRGFFMIPEVDDEVWVEFAYDDPDRPIVTGALFHGNALPNGAWNHAENDIKSIRTKSGNEIQIVDTAGQEEIRISTGDGKNSLSLTMGGGGTITFSSGTEMTISSTTVNIQASDTLNLEANDINITAGNQLAVSSGADTSISAGANIEVGSGANTSLEAGGSLEGSATGGSLSMTAATDLALEAGVNLSGDAGVNVDLTAGANGSLTANAMANLEGSASANVKGAMVNVEGSGMTSITGGVVKMN